MARSRTAACIRRTDPTASTSGTRCCAASSGKRPNVTLLDLNKKLCPNGVYTNKVDGIRMRMDGVHPTPEAVKWLTPWLTDALKR